MAALMESHGYEAFKIRIGKVCGNNEDMWPGRTEQLVPAVRKAIGDRTLLMVDANGCYTPEKAVEVGSMLKTYGVCHFEEPCPYWEYDWTRKVTEALDIPVAGGEQDFWIPQWKQMVNSHIVDIVQPDICYIGGLSRALQVAKMAQDSGMVCMPHVANHSLIAVFSLHMLGAIPNAGEYMEYCIDDLKWDEGIYDPCLEVKDGKVMIPSGPGWGVSINEERLKRAAYKKSS